MRGQNIIYMWDSQKWKVFHKGYEYYISGLVRTNYFKLFNY